MNSVYATKTQQLHLFTTNHSLHYDNSAAQSSITYEPGIYFTSVPCSPHCELDINKTLIILQISCQNKFSWTAEHKNPQTMTVLWDTEAKYHIQQFCTQSMNTILNNHVERISSRHGSSSCIRIHIISSYNTCRLHSYSRISQYTR